MAKQKRFQIVHDERMDIISTANIILDTVTGVLYLQTIYSNGCGLTPLLNAEGKPVVWELDKPQEAAF